jgi:hypothetical protein
VVHAGFVVADVPARGRGGFCLMYTDECFLEHFYGDGWGDAWDVWILFECLDEFFEF